MIKDILCNNLFGVTNDKICHFWYVDTNIGMCHPLSDTNIGLCHPLSDTNIRMCHPLLEGVIDRYSQS
ncbi:hypothetical protein R50073_07610 [Maricurvus nonylphenolicus]